VLGGGESRFRWPDQPARARATACRQLRELADPPSLLARSGDRVGLTFIGLRHHPTQAISGISGARWGWSMKSAIGFNLKGTTCEHSAAMTSELQHEKGGTPPGGGRWDHETMREAAQRPISGPGSTDTLAASGGLELPAHRSHPARAADVIADEPIPGERDASTLTHRQPGAIGGRFSGADAPPVDPRRLMDAATMHDRELEGGGGGR